MVELIPGYGVTETLLAKLLEEVVRLNEKVDLLTAVKVAGYPNIPAPSWWTEAQLRERGM